MFIRMPFPLRRRPCHASPRLCSSSTVKNAVNGDHLDGNEMILLNPSSHESGIYTEVEVQVVKSDMVDDSKETMSSRHSRTDVHMN